MMSEVRPAHELRKRVLNQLLGLGVHAARGLVENQQDLRIEGDRPREGQQLLLPDRETSAALAHRLIVLLRAAAR